MPVIAPAGPRAWIGAIVAASLGVACAAPAAPCGPARARVERVIDGDTIVVAGGVTVRYLLVDTPELHPAHPACYAPNAAQFNRDLVLGHTVELRYDVQCDDVYGRALAYVAVDGVDVNRALVERGYACVLDIPPDGAARVAELKAVEATARAARRGLWGACAPIPCR
jgi:micrococcal nuclease